MAADAAAFVKALGLTEVDVLGFSIGGFIAHVIIYSVNSFILQQHLPAWTLCSPDSR
jgi:hypothetical protein